MSAAVREELVEAVETVDGLSGSAYFQQAPKPGWFFVRLDRIAYPDRTGGVTSWQVVIWLPADLTQAEKWIDEFAGQIVAAVSPRVMAVQSVQPVQMQIESGTAPALVVAGIRETESE